MAKNNKIKKSNKTNKNKQTKIEIEKKKINVAPSNDSKEISKIIKYLIIVLLIFGGVYLLTVFITNHSSDSDYKTKVSEAEIQSSKILAGSIFKQSDNEYYVLFYNTKASDSSIYSDLYTNYIKKDNHTPIYYVDLHEGLNSKYISNNVNGNPTSLDDLRLNGPALMKITNKNISEFITDTTEISNKLS